MAYYNNNSHHQNKGGKEHKDSKNVVNKDFYNPYSFVPVNEKVYYLNEDEKRELDMIQDAPVKGGLSGTITVDFKAQTPFCVRGEGGSSANMDGVFFVPGSSVKGMLRSVFEIMTYSNIRNGIADDRYSMRDLRSPDYQLKATDKPQHSGFLVQLNGDFFIQECNSEPKTYKEIMQLAKVKDSVDSFRLQKGTTRDKYALLDSPLVKEGGKFKMWFFSNFIQGKKHEFLFDIPVFDEAKLIPLNEKEYKDFIFIHEKENDNASWKYWKRKLKNYSAVSDIAQDNFLGIVPCFFRTMDSGRSVRDLGFSYLYRQPYPYSIHHFVPSEHKKKGIDLSQAVFGFVNGSDALKGRVQVGNAFIKSVKPLGKQTFIMGSPKPTFFPFYIEQNSKGKLETYFSKNSTYISGYKRFLVSGSAQSGEEKDSKVTSFFYPMPAGTTFTSKIYFHNLHDYELGALLSAITFYQQDDCSHSLGYAKPFGYGRLGVTNCKLDFVDADVPMDDLYEAFLTKLCNRVECTKDDWLDDMDYLFYIAQGVYEPKKAIRYPKMKNSKEGQTSDEFAAIKNDKLTIFDFSPEP